MRRYLLLWTVLLLLAASLPVGAQTEEPAASVTIPITVDSGGNVSIPAGAPLDAALIAITGGAVAWAIKNGASFWLEVRRARLKSQTEADAQKRALELEEARTDNQIELSQSQQLKLLVEALAENAKNQEAAAARNQTTLDAFVRSIDALSENSRSVVTLVTAMNARTDFLVTQGQRLEEALTNGRTGTAKIVEEKMDTLEQRLSALEKKVDAVQAQNTQILSLLQNLLSLETAKTVGLAPSARTMSSLASTPPDLRPDAPDDVPTDGTASA